MGDRLRSIWNFDDLDVSEARFRAALAEEPTGDGRAEVLTQLARVEGLRDRFDEGDALLDQAEELAGSTPIVRIRIDLERGRLRRSSGDPEASMPLSEAAFERAIDAGEEFLAVDAAHMAAIAAPDLPARLAWAERGIELAKQSKDGEVTSWLGSLFNNVGWDCFDAGDYRAALDWFQRALAERERRPDEPERIAHALEAVEEARRMFDPSTDMG